MPARYFVQFREAPLALYDGSDPQLAAIPRVTKTDGRNKLDTQSAQAQQYVAHLATVQTQHLGAVSSALGRAVTPLRTMRHALNAAVVELTAAEAKRAATADGVLSVRPVGSHALATDLGPQFIGATALWAIPNGITDDIFASNFDGNTPPSKCSAALGDGVVVGDIDTGYNSLSPSFAPVDDTGYAITNPLGAGHYLGQCSVAGISKAGCNNKVIGVYDEIDDGVTVPYSVEDTQGHGSHTASTAAGDSRSATLNGYTTHISGMAPHANLVVFYGCAPAPKNCPDDALAHAADDAVAGGVVDVINFSISGGFDQWNEPTSKAFLAAETAGIFIAAAGGNTSASTPAAIAGTVNHFEPWVTTVAAANHTGGAIAPNMSVTGPGTPPANTQNIGLTETQGDTPLAATMPGTTPFKLSPQFHNTDTTGTDGCAAYPANTFQNAIALVRSLLGPAAIDVIKPEVQAPGTNILAAVSNDGTTNGPNLVALFNGTSMATPHTTGAGALLSGLHPSSRHGQGRPAREGWESIDSRWCHCGAGKKSGWPFPELLAHVVRELVPPICRRHSGRRSGSRSMERLPDGVMRLSPLAEPRHDRRMAQSHPSDACSANKDFQGKTTPWNSVE
ncbi:S8 family serine peptidase [Dokdonella soli]|uniref:Peptidase S8/S53 domain-containing protein n=1 Tax=Dokdonella soli TaxID=529810 RepID=A0ABP3TKM9_9GAMM